MCHQNASFLTRLWRQDFNAYAHLNVSIIEPFSTILSDVRSHSTWNRHSLSTDSASRLILSWRTTSKNVAKKAGQPSQKSGTKVSRFCLQRRVKNEAFWWHILEANRFCKKRMPLSLGYFFSTNQVFRFRVLGSTFKFGPGIPTLFCFVSNATPRASN